ncbi:MAG: hypothetical protein AAB577_00015 [Patescibacteria group bacterium]
MTPHHFLGHFIRCRFFGKSGGGFTLIELIVITAIIALFTALTLPNYRGGSQQLTLQRSAHKLAQDFRMAEELALSSQKFGDVTPQGYGIYFNKNQPNQYVLFADLNGDRRYSGVSEKAEQIYLETGVVIDTLTPGTADALTIVFVPPDPQVYIDNDLTLTQAKILVVHQQDSAKNKTICVNRGGLISLDCTEAAPPAPPPPPPPPPPCFANGTACAVAGDCCSGNCYVDADGDGYGTTTGAMVCKASASLGNDCYDANANARPGQTAYYTTNRGDGSFDYDCSGTIGKQNCSKYTGCQCSGGNDACPDPDPPYFTTEVNCWASGPVVQNCGVGWTGGNMTNYADCSNNVFEVYTYCAVAAQSGTCSCR